MLRKALPLRHVLVVAFLVVGLLPAMLITALAFYEARAVLKEEIKRDMTTRATATAEEIDRMLFERMQNVNSWSELEIMQEMRVGDVDKRLSEFLSDLKTSYRNVYTELYAMDAQGQVIASSDMHNLGHRVLPASPWLQAHLSRTQIRLSPVQDGQLPIAATIFNANTGEPIGQLVAVFNWEQVRHVLSEAVSGRSAAALFDGQGRLLESTPRWAKTQAAKKFKSAATTHGYQNFPGFGWRVELIESRGQAMTPVRHMAYIFIGLMALSIVLAASIALPVTRMITRPVGRLTQFARDYFLQPGIRLPAVHGPAEINTMAEAFAKMISDLEHSKESLTRAAKLAVVGEMAAAIGHEVRTPLGILRSSAQVLLREPALSPEAREVCGFITSETERLNRLVSSLVDAARPRPAKFAAADLAGLAGQVVAMLRMQAEKKGVALELAASGPITVVCDAEQITQVLLNLIMNAIQILDRAGRIVVSVSRNEGFARLDVADNGPGIPEDQREQIFDPFFTRRAGGIGLGLAVVRQIVLTHHGSISVHASPMHGAEFRVLLPLTGIEHA